MPEHEMDPNLLIDWVTEHYYLRYPEQARQYGDRGRAACRADVAHHWEFLQDASAVEQADLFTGYVLWLQSVLEHRGLDTRHIDASLELMETYLRDRIDPSAPVQTTRLLGVLALGRKALARPLATADAYALTAQNTPALAPLVDALCAGDRRTAGHTLFTTLAPGGRDFLDLAVGIIQPALYEVGYRWQNNKISVAQEHMATAICQSLLTSAYAGSRFAETGDDRRAILACIEGNHHSLGLRIVSDALEIAGWQVRYIGADTPARSLLGQIEAWQPQLLALSMSLPHQLGPARQLITQIKADMSGRRPEIAVGGLVVNSAPGVVKILGADYWFSDARTAVESLQ